MLVIGPMFGLRILREKKKNPMFLMDRGGHLGPGALLLIGRYCFLRTIWKLGEILWGCYSDEGREYIVGGREG